jgi:hypothetical protein
MKGPGSSGVSRIGEGIGDADAFVAAPPASCNSDAE